MKIQRGQKGFTLLELIISVGLFMVAISVALFATIGTNGLLSRTESRSVVAEGSRSVADAIRRAAANTGVDGITLLSDSSVNVGVQIKVYSQDQHQKTCQVIGRASNYFTTSGEEKYTLSRTGTTIALWIFPLSDTNLCPNLTDNPIYQNRLIANSAAVTNFVASLGDITCQTGCSRTQLLRYRLGIQTAAKQSGQASESRQSTIDIISAIPIGLVALPFAVGGGTNLSIDTSTLPNGQVGVAYNQTLSASGGSGNYSFSVAAPSLPPGLSLAPSGAITGTPDPAGAGLTYQFTARVTDTTTSQVSDKPLTITIDANSLVITTNSLPNGNQNSAYNQSLAASGGNPPYSGWVLINKTALPAGLSLNATTGAITGTPTATGTTFFDVQVGDSASHTAEKTGLSITVNPAAPPPLTITTTSLPSGTQNSPYSQSLAATGGVQPYSGWTLINGTSLPSGLSLNSSTGVVSGTPTVAGSFSFDVRVTDSVSTTAQKTGITLQILPGVTLLTITTSSLPDGTVGTAYSQTVAATGGTQPYSWSLNAGSGPIPLGLTLSSGGVISGTPTTAGVYPFTIKVTDASSNTATKALSITIAPTGTFTITTATIPDGATNTAYSQDVVAAGSVTPYTWSVASGTLPPGLSLSTVSNNGRISGTPTTAGTYEFVLQVNDGAIKGRKTATRSFTVTITVGAGTPGGPGTPGGSPAPGGA